MKQINPAMLVLAREARGLSQTDVGKRLGIRQATISRYESGKAPVPDETLAALARILDRPMAFFSWEAKLYNSSAMFFRKRKRLPLKDLNETNAIANIFRLQAGKLLQHYEVETPYSFHRFGTEFDPVDAARELRRVWQLPSGPIRNVVDTIESAGGVTFGIHKGTMKVDGISQWPLDQEMPPVFFFNGRISGDRQRWTLCHEIGHVVMHHNVSIDPEGEADLFASEFLMPENEIKPELPCLTLERAAALKSYWKVSMQAIVRRAKTLGAISKDRYSRLCKEIGYKGYRTNEPVKVQKETPQLFPELVKNHQRSQCLDSEQMRSFLGVSRDVFDAEYWYIASGSVLRLAR